MRIFITIIIMIIFFMISLPSSAFAATLTLSPTSNSAPLNSTFTVKLLIDTIGESTTSTDAVMLFDKNILTIVNVEEGDNGANPFYPDMFPNIAPGELYIGASVVDSIDTRSGTGTIATITFKGIAQGASDVTFDCTAGKTSDTNISKSDKNQTDIVTCASLTKGRYTIGTGTGTGITPQPTPTIASNIPATPTPTLPRSGSTETTMNLYGLAVILLVTGLGSRFLYRS